MNTAPTIIRPAIDGAQYLPLNLCRANEHNPRKRFAQKPLDELTDSIEKFGVMQPVLARPIPAAKRGAAQFEIVAGERRWRACKLVAERRKESDIAVIPAIVRELSDFDALELMTTENLQRQDLHPLEEAEGYEGLLRYPVTGGEFTPPRLRGYTVDELAARLGKSRGYVFARLKLLALVPEAREAFFEDKISASVALLIARMTPELQPKALEDVLRGWGGEPYSYRQAAEHLHRHYMLQLKSAAFDIGLVALVPSAGSCHACPKRTGASPELFDDDKSADTCTDTACFEAKTQAHGRAIVQRARERGHQVLSTDEEIKRVMPHGTWSLANTGHIDIEEPAPELTGQKAPLREVLGGADFKHAIVIDLGDDKPPLTIARYADVRAALKAKGIAAPADAGDAAPNGARPSRAATKLSAAEIKNQLSYNVRRSLVQRMPQALCTHLEADGRGGFQFTSDLWAKYLAEYLWQTTGLTRSEVQTLITGAAKVSGKHETLWINDLTLEQLTRLCTLLLLVDSIDNERDHRDDGTTAETSNAMAEAIGFDLATLRDQVTQEVDADIGEQIAALATVEKPVKKPAKVAGKTTTRNTPAPTPETALAAAVKKASAKKTTAKAKAAEGASVKANGKVHISDEAAWPFPEGAAA